MRPLVLLLACALLGAAACQKGTAPQVRDTNPMIDSADQVLFGVRHNVTDAGLMRARLVSDTGFIFDDNTRIELLDVHLTFFTAQGQQDAVLTSLEGTYRTRTGNMEARGDVLVVSTDGRRLTTEQLRFDPARNQISSDSAFVMTTPDGRRLEGIGFISDPDMNNIRILAAAGGRAGPVSVPGP